MSFYVSYAWQDTDTNRKNRHKYKARVSTGLRISISIGRMVEERCIDYRIIKKTHNFLSSFSKYDMFVIEYVEVLLTLIPKWCTKTLTQLLPILLISFPVHTILTSNDFEDIKIDCLK